MCYLSFPPLPPLSASFYHSLFLLLPFLLLFLFLPFGVADRQTDTLIPSTVHPSSKIFSTPNSFPTLPLPLKTSYPATTRHYLISSTFMPHSSQNNLLTPTTPGSPHTFKHLKPFAGTSSMFTSAPSTPHLEPKPSPISNKPPIDTINLSLLPSRNTTLLSFTPPLSTLDIFGEQFSSSSQISLSTPYLHSILLYR